MVRVCTQMLVLLRLQWVNQTRKKRYLNFLAELQPIFLNYTTSYCIILAVCKRRCQYFHPHSHMYKTFVQTSINTADAARNTIRLSRAQAWCYITYSTVNSCVTSNDCLTTVQSCCWSEARHGIIPDACRITADKPQTRNVIVPSLYDTIKCDASGSRPDVDVHITFQNYLCY